MGDGTKKTKQSLKNAILDKLKESIMEEEDDNKGVEDQSKRVDNPDDAAEFIKKIDKIMKTKTNNILSSA